jgi:hypothetical protein
MGTKMRKNKNVHICVDASPKDQMKILKRISR